MSQIVVVRHGRTEANARGLLLGRADPALDDVGRAQARALATAVLRSGPVDAVVSSPLLRARQTAEAFGCEVRIDERFVELDYGEWDGRPVADVPAEVWSEWRSDPDFAPPGGESLGALDRRVRAACEDLAAVGGTVVVVTHVSPLKAAVTWALGVGDETAWRTRVDPASITRISTEGPVPVLRSFNETAHLL